MSAVMSTAVAATPVTAAERAKAETTIKKAKVRLVTGHPFFAQLVLSRPIKLSDTVATAYVTPRGSITVGTRFAAGLTVQQMVLLLAHEAGHYVFLHALRRNWREPRRWNIACDAVINDLLVAGGVGEWIPGGVQIEGAKDKTSEKIYDELPEQKEGNGRGRQEGEPGNGSQEGEPGNDGEYQPGEGWDDLAEGDEDDGPMDEATKREIEQQVKVELSATTQVAKQRGHLPAGIEHHLVDVINPRTPWHILLERYMTNYVKADYSFRRPARRMIEHGFYFPSADRLPQMGTVVIVRDTSGSCMDRVSQGHFLGHINSILEKRRPEKVYVLDVDAAVHRVQELTVDDLPLLPAKASPRGGGGTSFKPPFRWVKKNGVEPEVLIYMTDMYGDFPEKAPEYQTVWLSTTDIKVAPFGDVIMYDLKTN